MSELASITAFLPAVHDHGEVLEVNEPQVWVLIGVFATAIFGMIGIVTTSFNRTVTTAVVGLRETMDARFETMDARFAATRPA